MHALEQLPPYEARLNPDDDFVKKHAEKHYPELCEVIAHILFRAPLANPERMEIWREQIDKDIALRSGLVAIIQESEYNSDPAVKLRSHELREQLLKPYFPTPDATPPR
jgi:hypothetical protein